MFVAEKVVFVELQRTGSNQIREFLSQLVPGRRIGHHNRASEELLRSGRSFLGSIRDPWEWYVSLWAFGCDGRGGVFQRVMTNARDRWRPCYSDVSDPSRFREWLWRVHDERFRHDIGEGFGGSSVSACAGLLTYRYLKLCCRQGASSDFFDLGSPDVLSEYERSECYIDHSVRSENLVDDLVRVLGQCGVTVSSEHVEKMRSAARTNASSRSKRAAYYYDSATEAFVNEREKLIAEKFGYVPPSANGAG